MTGVALVGLGDIGQVHLRALRGSARVRLVALCDRDPALLQDSASEEDITEEFSELLGRDDVDLVDICLPHDLHAPLAIMALEAGKHVLLEKPMAMTVAECDDVLAAAREADRHVGVSHNQLFYEPHRILAQMIESGRVGKVRSIRARLAIGGSYGAWRADPVQAGGGLLIDAGVHRVYVMQMLGGPVVAVSAVMDRPGEEASFSVALEFADGTIGTIDATYEGPAGLFDDQVELVGSEAIVEVPGCEAHFEGFATGPQLRVWQGGRWSDHDVSDTWDDSVIRSVEAAVSAVDDGRPPPVDGNAGRETVRVIEAAYQSARTGQKIAL